MKTFNPPSYNSKLVWLAFLKDKRKYLKNLSVVFVHIMKVNCDPNKTNTAKPETLTNLKPHWFSNVYC